MTLEDIRQSAFMVPIFPVTDMARALDYYVNTLGFEKRWEWGEPVDYACVSFGPTELFLCLNGQGTPGTWMYLFLRGIDDYTALIQERGAEILHGPEDEPWGMREIHVRDPDGNTLRIGTSLEMLAGREP